MHPLPSEQATEIEWTGKNRHKPRRISRLREFHSFPDRRRSGCCYFVSSESHSLGHDVEAPAIMPATLEWPLTDETTTVMEHFHGGVSPNDVIELPILLPEWQVTALEEAARGRGMTIGQLLRRVFSDLFPAPITSQLH
jgi:hypothetical protein